MENKIIYNELFKIVEKLKSTNDPKRKYEYILWLGKKLNSPKDDIPVSYTHLTLPTIVGV